MTDACESKMVEIPPELTASLRRYLPDHMVKSLPTALQEKDVTSYLEHLTALLRTISTYIPRHLVRGRLAHPDRDPVRGFFAEGTLMMADISGFTAMSERLSVLGREGAEEVTRIINACFTSLLEVIFRHGGSLLKFGGDALLVLFLGEDHVSHAVQAAWQIQQTMRRFERTETSQGTFPLRISIGLNSGAFFTASVGTAAKLEYVITGRQVNEAARTEDAASAGQIFVHLNTYRLMREMVKVREVDEGLYEVVQIRKSANGQMGKWANGQVSKFANLQIGTCTRQGESANQFGSKSAGTVEELEAILAQVEALAPYIPQDLLKRIIAAPQRVEVEGEHRPVTVLFANFLGMTEIIEALGEEGRAEITAILNRYFVTMEGIVSRYGGVVNKIDLYTKGDKLLALFGAPVAHEDDPERAVRAAMEMQAAMGEIGRYANEQMSKWANGQIGKSAKGQESRFADLQICKFVNLQQRIGINTGHVFAGNVGSDTRKEYTVMGDAVNLAARLMSTTEWGETVVSSFTQRKVAGEFDLEELPAVRVKGKAKPVSRYRVRGEAEGLAPLWRKLLVKGEIVGRERELSIVREVADRVLSGQGQVLEIVGEAGIGKSRLASELVRYWLERGGGGYGGDCQSYGRSVPYLPWIDLMRAYFLLSGTDTPTTRREKVAGRMVAVDPQLADWIALMGNLLSVPIPESPLLSSLDAGLRKQRLWDITLQLLRAEAEASPLLLLLEDIHWIDDASLELLDYVAANGTDQPILLCLAHRPEVEWELAARREENYTLIELAELPAQESLALVSSMLNIPELPPELSTLVLQKSQGNPFFVEEVVRSLRDAGYLKLDEGSGRYALSGDLTQVEVPDTIQGVIMSRIDRLSELDRSTLKVAAVIGRLFQYWVLRGIYPFSITEEQLLGAVNDLEQLDLTALGRPEPDLEYIFKQIMTRQVAYESLLFARRRELHHKIGEYFEAAHPEALEEYYELLAHHYSLSGNADKALDYLIKAAQKAQQVYGNKEAIEYLNQALRVVDKVSFDATAPRITIHELLGDVQTIIGEYDEALENYERAQVLLEGVESQKVERLADVCRKLGEVYASKGNYPAALDWMRKGLNVLEKKGMSRSCEAARIHIWGGLYFYYQGDYKEALKWGRHGLQIVEGSENYRELAQGYNLWGNTRATMGDRDGALECYGKSLTFYEKIEDARGIATSHNNIGMTYYELGNWEESLEHYQNSLNIYEKIGYAKWIAAMNGNLGEVYKDKGDLARAVEHYQKCLELAKRIGHSYLVALTYNNLGSVYVRRARLKEAREYLARSLQLFTQIDSKEHLSELYRHLGELHLKNNQTDEAWQFCQQSLGMILGDQLQEGLTRRVLGQVHLARGEYAQAETELQTSLRILEELNSQYEVGKTLLQLARLYAGMGREAEAADALGRAIETFQRLGAKLDLEEATAFRNGK